MSDFLQPHGLLNARPPSPSPAPRACSNCPSSWWCHPNISSSVIPSHILNLHDVIYQLYLNLKKNSWRRKCLESRRTKIVWLERKIFLKCSNQDSKDCQDLKFRESIGSRAYRTTQGLYPMNRCRWSWREKCKIIYRDEKDHQGECKMKRNTATEYGACDR